MFSSVCSTVLEKTRETAEVNHEAIDLVASNDLLGDGDKLRTYLRLVVILKAPGRIAGIVVLETLERWRVLL